MRGGNGKPYIEEHSFSLDRVLLETLFDDEAPTVADLTTVFAAHLRQCRRAGPPGVVAKWKVSS